MSRNIKIFLSALIVFLICIFWCGRVNAERVDFGKLKSDKNLYCINHSGHMKTGVFANYSKIATITIEGDIAKTSINGKEYKSKSYVNAEIAYILAGGNYIHGYGDENNKRPRQLALWSKWNYWYEKVQVSNQLNLIGLSTNLYDEKNDKVDLTDEAKKLIQEAETYAAGKSTSQSSIELISKSNKSVTTTEGKFFGPFRVKYSGKIKSIGIFDSDSKTITDKIQICTSTTASSAINKNTNFADSNLPNNKDFYIYVDNSNLEGFSLGGIKINMESTNLKAVKFSVLVSKRDVGTGTAQRLIRVENKYETTGGDNSITIGFVTHTDLTIKKADAYDYHALEGAKFILRHDNKCAIAKIDDNGKYEVTGWTPYEEDATRIEIGINGTTIGIDRDEKTLYALQEVEAPEGYECKLGYQGKSTGIYDNSVYGDKYGLSGSKYFFDIDSSNIGKTVEIKLLNPKKVTLNVVKVNKSNTEQKLANIEFYFKHDNKYAIVEIINNKYNVKEWTSDVEKASKLVTNENGEFSISFVEDANIQSENRFIYGLQEIQNTNKINVGQEPKFVEGNGTYKQYEGGYKLNFYVNGEYNTSTEKIDYKNLKEVSIVVGNELPEEKIVTLRKVSSSNNNVTVNATFVIAHDNSYANAVYENGVWVIKKWLPYNLQEYNLDSEEVTKIKLVNGEAKIKLPVDDKLYGFIEVATEEGYTLNMTYLSGQSKNITPFDGTTKDWSKNRGIDSNGILNNWQDTSTGKKISEFYFYVNKNIASNDEIKICLTNGGGAAGVQKLIVKGRVWLDTPIGKTNQGNKIYDDADGYVKNGVKISLIEKSTGKVATYTDFYQDGFRGEMFEGNTVKASNTFTGAFEFVCNKPIIKDINNSLQIGKRTYENYRQNTVVGYEELNINDYYLKFEYPRTNENGTITVYTPISYNYSNTDDLAKIRDYENNSKAISGTAQDEAEINDLGSYSDTCFYTTIERTRIYKCEKNYDGTYNTKKQYRTSNWEDTNIAVGVLQYMNLGLKERVATGGDIVENLEYVRIVMPSQTNPNEKNTYIYEYGSLYGDEYRESINTNDEEFEYYVSPQVKYQSKTISKYYSRPFYPSDIYRTSAVSNDNEKMQVYVVYSITITNSVPMDGEIWMEVKSLIDTYDTNRYQLSIDQGGSGNNMVDEMQGDFGNWNDDGNGKLTRKLTKKINNSKDKGDFIGHDYDGNEYNRDDFVAKLSSYESITYYVQFRVKEDAIKAILDHPNGIIEENPTKATAQVSHYYKEWHSHDCGEEGCQGHSCYIYDYSTTKDISDDAPYMVFFIDTNLGNRTIQGTVFYDKEKENDAKDIVGDGQYSDGDGKVQGVKVELRKANSSDGYTYNTGNGIDDPFTGNENSYAKIYSTDYKGGKDAVTTTDASGHYEFVGITPGEYFLVFKYPDGSMYIKGVEQYDESVAITTPNYLKSTIVTNNIIQNAILKQNNLDWYRDIGTDSTYSVAVDNLPLRSKLNEQQNNKLYGDGTEPTIKTMIAGSAPFKIKIENENLDYCSSDEKVNVNSFQSCNYSMFSFGIIRQAEQKATLEKVISNVKLTHDPQVIFDGNPEKLTSQNLGVTDLDNDENNGGSTYTRVEIAQEALYGSTLTLTYELRVKNESENNYYETQEAISKGYYGYWYMFGEKTDVKLVTLSTNVDDYLDKYLTYEGVTNNAECNKLTGYTEEIKKITQTYYTKDYTSNVFNIVNNVNNPGISEVINEQETLMYQLTYNNKIQKGGIETVSLNASKLLSGREEEWNYQNSAEIKKLENRTQDGTSSSIDNTDEKKSVKLVITPEKYNSPNVKIEEKHYPNTEVVITTPTGMDKQSIVLYSVTGVISLIALYSGIIVIKKKVL